MAALCTGISYGLSQSCLSNENKELIFVKLTDSAYRAIEEYQKNQVSTQLLFLPFHTKSTGSMNLPNPIGTVIIQFDVSFLRKNVYIQFISFT